MAVKKKKQKPPPRAARRLKKVAKEAKRAVVKAAAKVRKAKAAPIPKGYHVVTPFLTVRGANEAIAFYKAAFGAREKGRMPGPDGKLMHAEIQIGDSRVMLSDEYPEMGSKAPQTLGGSPAGLLIYTRDVDRLFAQAVKAGAKVTLPVADMFWGDRYGKLEDPFGHVWAVATHKEDLTNREMAKRAAAAMRGPPTV
jgi:PhnB protein